MNVTFFGAGWVGDRRCDKVVTCIWGGGLQETCHANDKRGLKTFPNNFPFFGSVMVVAGKEGAGQRTKVLSLAQ